MRTWALTLAASTTLALGAQTAGAANAFSPTGTNASPAATRGAQTARHSFAPLAGLPLLVLHQPRNAAEAALVAEIDRGTARRVPDTWARRLLTRLVYDLS